MAAIQNAECLAWPENGHHARNCQARQSLPQSRSGANQCTNRPLWPRRALVLTITSTSGAEKHEVRQGAKDTGHIAAQGYVHLRAMRPGPLHAKVRAGAAGQDEAQGVGVQIRMETPARWHRGTVSRRHRGRCAKAATGVGY